MARRKNTELVLAGVEEGQSLDDYLTRKVLDASMGDIVKARENSSSAREMFAVSLVYNAVFEMDVEAIRQIAYRIDGTVPVDKERGEYANILGDALDDVLDYTVAEQLKVTEQDSPAIAMAKVLVYIASQPAGSNWQKRKDRNAAAQIVLERVGGRKAEPVKAALDVRYVKPKWMGEGNEVEPEGEGSVDGRPVRDMREP